MLNIHRIIIALFFILLCTTADDLTDCSTDIYKHPADAHLIKAGTTWIANALRREKFELKAYFCEKVWCVDGASIYFCNNHPEDDTVKGQYREIAKRMETLLEKCEDKDKGTVGGEIRSRTSHLRVQYDDGDCYVKKPDNF